MEEKGKDRSQHNKRLIFWKQEKPKDAWKSIPDTPGARAKAIDAGAMYFTWCGFSHEPGPDTPEPIRFGDLPLDFDSKENPQRALDDVRRLCCHFLPEHYGIDPRDMRFFCSGSKGFHAEIPAHFFGLDDGHPELPLIYKRLVQGWAEELGLPTIDLSLYCQGKGKMWRIPNVRRSNGRYKVPLTRDDVAFCSLEALWNLSDSQRRVA